MENLIKKVRKMEIHEWNLKALELCHHEAERNPVQHNPGTTSKQTC